MFLQILVFKLIDVKYLELYCINPLLVVRQYKCFDESRIQIVWYDLSSPDFRQLHFFCVLPDLLLETNNHRICKAEQVNLRKILTC